MAVSLFVIFFRLLKRSSQTFLFLISIIRIFGSVILSDDSSDDILPTLVIHSPSNGTLIPLQLHGWESLIIDVNISVSNFESRDGSLALFIGNGELLLMERWQPLNGNMVITCELPFPDKDEHSDRLSFLSEGNQFMYRLEFSLMDAGNEVILILCIQGC
jgi:hypothetical protein